MLTSKNIKLPRIPHTRSINTSSSSSISKRLFGYRAISSTSQNSLAIDENSDQIVENTSMVASRITCITECTKPLKFEGNDFSLLFLGYSDGRIASFNIVCSEDQYMFYDAQSSNHNGNFQFLSDFLVPSEKNLNNSLLRPSSSASGYYGSNLDLNNSYSSRSSSPNFQQISNSISFQNQNDSSNSTILQTNNLSDTDSFNGSFSNLTDFQARFGSQPNLSTDNNHYLDEKNEIIALEFIGIRTRLKLSKYVKVILLLAAVKNGQNLLLEVSPHLNYQFKILNRLSIPRQIVKKVLIESDTSLYLLSISGILYKLNLSENLSKFTSIHKIYDGSSDSLVAKDNQLLDAYFVEGQPDKSDHNYIILHNEKTISRLNLKNDGDKQKRREIKLLVSFRKHNKLRQQGQIGINGVNSNLTNSMTTLMSTSMDSLATSMCSLSTLQESSSRNLNKCCICSCSYLYLYSIDNQLFIRKNNLNKMIYQHDAEIKNLVMHHKHAVLIFDNENTVCLFDITLSKVQYCYTASPSLDASNHNQSSFERETIHFSRNLSKFLKITNDSSTLSLLQLYTNQDIHELKEFYLEFLLSGQAQEENYLNSKINSLAKIDIQMLSSLFINLDKIPDLLEYLATHQEFITFSVIELLFDREVFYLNLSNSDQNSIAPWRYLTPPFIQTIFGVLGNTSSKNFSKTSTKRKKLIMKLLILMENHKIQFDIHFGLSICEELYLIDGLIFIFCHILKDEVALFEYIVDKKNYENMCFLVNSVLTFQGHQFKEAKLIGFYQFVQLSCKTLLEKIKNLIKDQSISHSLSNPLIESKIFYHSLKIFPETARRELLAYLIKLADGFEIIFHLPDSFFEFLLTNLDYVEFLENRQSIYSYITKYLIKIFNNRTKFSSVIDQNYLDAKIIVNFLPNSFLIELLEATTKESENDKTDSPSFITKFKYLAAIKSKKINFLSIKDLDAKFIHENYELVEVTEQILRNLFETDYERFLWLLEVNADFNRKFYGSKFWKDLIAEVDEMQSLYLDRTNEKNRNVIDEIEVLQQYHLSLNKDIAVKTSILVKQQGKGFSTIKPLTKPRLDLNSISEYFQVS